VGAALCHSEHIRKVSFTGSTAVGKVSYSAPVSLSVLLSPSLPAPLTPPHTRTPHSHPYPPLTLVSAAAVADEGIRLHCEEGAQSYPTLHTATAILLLCPRHPATLPPPPCTSTLCLPLYLYHPTLPLCPCYSAPTTLPLPHCTYYIALPPYPSHHASILT
jgi:hypothetical protein